MENYVAMKMSELQLLVVSMAEFQKHDIRWM